MRLEITKKTDLVLRGFCSLEGHDGRRTASQMADHLGITHQMVPKLMEPLVKMGWVESTPGRSGGYELQTDLKDVSLLELIEAVEGVAEDDRCVLRGTPCPAVELCAVHDAWLPARTALLDKLASTTIAEVRESPAMCGPEGSRMAPHLTAGAG